MDPIVEGKAADDMEIENLNMGGGTSSAVCWMRCCLPCLAAGAVWLVPELDVMPHVLAWACKACCACHPPRDGVPLLSAHRHAIVATAHTMCAVLSAP